LRQHTVYASGNWADRKEDWNGPGEVLGAKREFVDGTPPPWFEGGCVPLGTRTQLTTGASINDPHFLVPTWFTLAPLTEVECNCTTAVGLGMPVSTHTTLGCACSYVLGSIHLLGVPLSCGITTVVSHISIYGDIPCHVTTSCTTTVHDEYTSLMSSHVGCGSETAILLLDPPLLVNSDVEIECDCATTIDFEDGDERVWTKYTVPYTDLSTAATSITITVATLSAKTALHMVVGHCTTTFSGGGITNLNLTFQYDASNMFVGLIGNSPNASQYIACQSNTSASWPSGTILGMGSMSGSTPVKLKAENFGMQNLSVLTAGSLDIYLQTSTLP